MKKSLLFIPMLSSLATLPLLIASKCDQKETQEQKDEKLAKKYEKEYINKQRYVFDDFDQFKMKSEYFQLIKNPSSSEAWKDYSNRNIKTYWLSKKFIEDFNKWYEDFQWKFKIFKKIMYFLIYFFIILFSLFLTKKHTKISYFSPINISLFTNI